MSVEGYVGDVLVLPRPLDTATTGVLLVPLPNACGMWCSEDGGCFRLFKFLPSVMLLLLLTCCVLHRPPQGRALLLLEQHSDAESALLEGLAMAPSHLALQEDLKSVQDILAQQEQEKQQLLADVRKASMEGAGHGPEDQEAAAAVGAAQVTPAAGSSSPIRRARSDDPEVGAAATAVLRPKR